MQRHSQREQLIASLPFWGSGWNLRGFVSEQAPGPSLIFVASEAPAAATLQVSSQVSQRMQLDCCTSPALSSIRLLASQRLPQCHRSYMLCIMGGSELVFMLNLTLLQPAESIVTVQSARSPYTVQIWPESCPQAHPRCVGVTLAALRLRRWLGHQRHAALGHRQFPSCCWRCRCCR